MNLKQNLGDVTCGIKGGIKVGKKNINEFSRWFKNYFYSTTRELRKEYSIERREEQQTWLAFTFPFYMGAFTGLDLTLNYLNKDTFTPNDVLLTFIGTVFIPCLDRGIRLIVKEGEDDDLGAGLVGRVREIWQYLMKEGNYNHPRKYSYSKD